MRIVAEYSFADGKKIVTSQYSNELKEIETCIQQINAASFKNKVSEEKTMRGRKLYSPGELNEEFKRILNPQGWSSKRVSCQYSTSYYVNGYSPTASIKGAFRDMDFIKNNLGVEVQFGKYAFMVYNVAAKMTIFSNLGHIKAGIEIVPTAEFAKEMSTGVSYFEQFAWDLNQRGNADIDIPVLILGIDK